MHGGFHGATDEAGQLVEPGWSLCGYPSTTESPPERTWAAIQEGV